MKIFLVFACFLFAGHLVIAQPNPADLDLPKLLVGNWQVQEDNSFAEPKTITFYADGIINLNNPGSKLSQRFKVYKATSGYQVIILEVINGNPLSSFNIVPLNEEEMQLTYGEAPKLSYKRLKKLKG
jgi:hypothetical protein